MSHPKRDVCPVFGPRPFVRIEPGQERETDDQLPETCCRCGGTAVSTLPSTGVFYCASCHRIPGGEFAAYRDDRTPKGAKEEDKPAEPEAPRAPETHVKIRDGIEIPARFRRLANAG